ncbi:MAG: peptidoglycan-binding protein LysM [Methylophaga sp.]|nr:MAG: peptidoglycan-binding protein LysM [Methylophaga sp.]
MGLFSFITDAGSKLGGEIFDVTHATEEAIPSTVTPEQIDTARAQSITDNIAKSAVLVEDLVVTVNGPAALLAGKVNTQACSEKLTLIAGNQFGIGNVDCQLEVANPEPESIIYTVKSGDTLGKIAKAEYGDASKYTLIFEANQPILQDPDKIYVGQNLRIPTL